MMRNIVLIWKESRVIPWLFSLSWEQRKVADIASDTRGGGTPTTSNEAYWSGDIPWIQSSDLTEGIVFGVKPRKHISKSGLNSSATQLVPENSIAVVTRVGVGKLAYMPYLYTTSQDFLSLCRLQTEPVFTVYGLYQMLQGELSAVQGTSIKGMTKEDLLSKVISVPKSMDEQAQIGTYFSSLDNLITLHHRQEERSGHNPFQMQRRITFTWEQRKLGEIAEIVGGGTPSTSNPSYWDGDIDWYAPAEMEGQRYAVGSVRKITEAGLQNSSAKILPAHKTVLFTSRAGIGKMAILKLPGATNQGFQSLILKDGYNPYFIYSMGEEIKAKAEGVASGSTFLEISGKMLGNIEISIPRKAEQDAIAVYFERLDDLITLHQREYFKRQTEVNYVKYNQRDGPVLRILCAMDWCL